MSESHQTHPIDPDSAARLAADGLRFELLAPEDEAVAPWMDAVNRGFHEPRPKPEFIEARRYQSPHRRIAGVWDDTLQDAAAPVATASSWPTELTVPGGRSVTAWAISTFTPSRNRERDARGGAARRARAGCTGRDPDGVGGDDLPPLGLCSSRDDGDLDDRYEPLGVDGATRIRSSAVRDERATARRRPRDRGARAPGDAGPDRVRRPALGAVARHRRRERRAARAVPAL